MRRAFAAVLATAVLLSLPAASPAADRPPDRCAKARSRTVAANAAIRVYRLRSVLWGCRQKTGRTMRLDDALSVSATTSIGSYVAAINGRWVALVEPGNAGAIALGGAANDRLHIADVVARRKRLVFATTAEVPRYGLIANVAVTAGGRLAWMAEESERLGPRTRSIHVSGPSGQFVVDQGGPEIGEGSLAISGARAYWMHGDEPRSALLP